VVAGFEKSKVTVERRPSSLLMLTMRWMKARLRWSSSVKRSPIPLTMPVVPRRTTSAWPSSST